MDTWSLKVNWLGLLNIAALYFGGRWVLGLLGIPTSWGQYTGAFLAAFLVWILANVNISTTWTYRRSTRRR